MASTVLLLSSACGNSEGSSGTSATSTSPTSTATGGSRGGTARRSTHLPRPGVPGVTDSEIRYDVIGTKSNNPLGICILDCYTSGIKAYFAYRNSQGGIYGRKLVVGDVIDDELNLNQQKSLDVISQGDAFGVFSATLLASGWGDLDQAGVPTYTWGINAADSANRTHNFPSTVIRCADCTRATVPWVASHVGAKKAASIGYGISENSKVCTKSVADSFDKYRKQSGVELAYTNDDLDYGLPNGIGPQVTAMKDAGVDFISTCIDMNGMKTLAQELHRQGMDKVVLYHPNSYNQEYVKDAGDLFEGDVVAVQFRPLEADPGSSAMNEFRTWMKKQGSPLSELAMVGWLNASLAYDGLLAAGPEFDRASVTDATNALKGWTADGLVSPVDWADAHVPYTAAKPVKERPECSALVKVEHGTFVPLVSATRPWQCWDKGADVEFTPTPTDFE